MTSSARHTSMLVSKEVIICRYGFNERILLTDWFLHCKLVTVLATFAICYRLSVCLSSVTFVRRWNFRQCFYATGCFTPSYSCTMQAPKLLLDASVDRMISRFKLGSSRIGSEDSIFLTSLNALSCSAPHSTSGFKKTRVLKKSQPSGFFGF